MQAARGRRKTTVKENINRKTERAGPAIPEWVPLYKKTVPRRLHQYQPVITKPARSTIPGHSDEVSQPTSTKTARVQKYPFRQEIALKGMQLMAQVLAETFEVRASQDGSFTLKPLSPRKAEVTERRRQTSASPASKLIRLSPTKISEQSSPAKMTQSKKMSPDGKLQNRSPISVPMTNSTPGRKTTPQQSSP